MKSEQQYIDLYESSKHRFDELGTPLLTAEREAAAEAFTRTGFPSGKDERYRYTDVQALFSLDFGLNINRLPVSLDPYKTFRCFVPNLNSLLYFIVNDTFCPPQTPIAALPDGVIVDSLWHAASTKPEIISDYYNRLAANKDAVSSLNTMFVQDGLVVIVPRGVRMEQPVQIVNMLHSAVDMMANRRVLVILEEDSALNILFCDHTDSRRELLSTVVTEIYIGENASLDITSIEETHAKNRLIANTFIRQEARSRLRHNVVTLLGGATRNRLDVLLSGEGAECVLNGAAILDKQQHADNNTLVTHAASHCSSRELYKYVLDDSAVGAFAGKVLVAQGAGQTDSEMRNRNLCATKQARMYTQPMLEIYADDVKCSHGATVGQLNDAALFYMRQRGIPLAEARRLLQIAFMNEVIENIRLTPLRERLRYLIEKRFRNQLSACEGCTLCV